MNKRIVTLIALGALLLTTAPAQEKKPTDAAKPARTPSQELMIGWQSVFGKLITMAQDFPQEKYDFKAQKDQRTFGGNLIHVAADCFITLSSFTGAPAQSYENEDSLVKKYATKEEIVKLLSEAAKAGEQVIKDQGDAGLAKEVKYPWANAMVHGSFLLYGVIEHAGEHYGQLVVYYRLNGIVPPASRPRK